MSRCRKLARAHDLLLLLLSRGPVLVAVCLSRARELGIRPSTTYAARRRLPIKATRLPFRNGPAYWELIGGAPAAPTFWRTAISSRPCAGCGELMVGAHYMVRRCRRCRLDLKRKRARPLNVKTS
jgi:hypothetical protein